MKVLILISSILFFQVAWAEEPHCSKETPDLCLEDADKAYTAQGPKEAERILKVACEFESARACLRYGHLLKRLRRPDEARRAYQRACEINKDKECASLKRLDSK